MNYDERPWTKYYDEWVDPNITIPEKTYLDFLQEGLSRNHAHPAMHFMGKTITYGELDELSGRFANFLSSIGYGKGVAVSIVTPNIPQNQIVNVGICRAGCIAQGISILLTPNELAYQLNHSGAKVLLILDMAFEETFMKIHDKVPELTHVVVCNIGEYLPPLVRILGKALKKLPSGKVVPVPGKTVLTFREIMRTYPDSPPRVDVHPDDTCLIQYTGGTTGTPKGAEMTHRNVVTTLVMYNHWMQTKVMGEIWLSAFPFFHIAGLFVGMVQMTTTNTQILIPDPRNVKHLVKEYAKYRPTGICNVPTIYQRLVDEPSFRSLDHSNCQVVFSGASPLTDSLLAELESVIGEGKVQEFYGMTETMPSIFDPKNNKKKVGSVGLPWPTYRVKLVDLENGTREVPVGEEGEYIVQGKGVMRGYWRDPEETAHAMREFQGEKWFFTGDVLKMDEDGYFYLVDRVKDMIDVSGYNVFSRELEDKLYQHAAIEFCAVVGMPDPQKPATQIVKAVIQLIPEYRDKDANVVQEDIRTYCKENMAPYKVPKIIEIVDQIPLTAVGKVDKKTLR
jgi:long-chain acyl-CoA synthetase